jgi:hypothetical protein
MVIIAEAYQAGAALQVASSKEPEDDLSLLASQEVAD